MSLLDHGHNQETTTMITRPALLVVLLCASTPAVLAASGDAKAPLCITNVNQIRLTLDPIGGEPFEVPEKDRVYSVRISGREELSVRACSFNPILYSYSTGPQTTTQLPDIVAATQFATAIKDAISVMAAAGAAQIAPGDGKQLAQERPTQTKGCSQIQLESVNGITLQTLSGQIRNLVALFEQIPERIEQTHNPRDPMLEESKQTFSGALMNVKAIRGSLAALNQYAIARLAQRPVAIKIVSPAEVIGTYESVPDFRTLATQRSKGCVDDYVSQLNRAIEAIEYAAGERATLISMLDTAETFDAIFSQVGVDKELATVRFSSKNTTKQPVAITKNSTFEKLYNDRTKQYVAKTNEKGIGEFSISVEPELGLRLSIAPGAIYSFVKQPRFSAKPATDGTFTIAQTESDYAAASGMIALGLGFERYSFENVRPFLQVGIAPKKNELAFLLGAGLAFPDLNNALLSFGAIYQERDQLVSGLSVGDTLTSADDLKFDQEFEAGFYVGLAYNLTAK
jgi:hypothetical protein